MLRSVLQKHSREPAKILQRGVYKYNLQADPDSLSKIVEHIPESLLNKSEIKWARGLVIQRFENDADAETFMESALQIDSERNLDLIVQLGSLKLQTSFDVIKVLGVNEPTKETRIRLESIKSLFWRSPRSAI